MMEYNPSLTRCDKYDKDNTSRNTRSNGYFRNIIRSSCVFNAEDIPWMKDFVLEFRTNNLNRVADMMAAELDKIKE
jgi:hypothetical protein